MPNRSFKYAGQTCDQILELPLKQAQALLIQHVENMRDNRKLVLYLHETENFNSYKDIALPGDDDIFLTKISIITLDKWGSSSNYNRYAISHGQ